MSHAQPRPHSSAKDMDTSAALGSCPRRVFLGGGLALAAGWLAPRSVAGKDRKFSKDEKSPAELIDAKARRAIDRGLEYLARRQVKSGPNAGSFGQDGYSAGVATTGMGGLAFMCAGNAPGMGKYGKQIDHCVDFILRTVNETGYIARTDNRVNENMYGHGFAMLFLAQAYGMSQKAEVGEKLRKAVRLTCSCQTTKGVGGTLPKRAMRICR